MATLSAAPSPTPLPSAPTSPPTPRNLGTTRQIQCPLRQIPRLHWRDPLALEIARANQPLVFTDAELVDNVIGKWTMPYLQTNLNPTSEFTIYETNADDVFMYDKFTSDGVHDTPYHFQPKVTQSKCNFQTFGARLKQALVGGSSGGSSSGSSSGSISTGSTTTGSTTTGSTTTGSTTIRNHRDGTTAAEPLESSTAPHAATLDNGGHSDTGGEKQNVSSSPPSSSAPRTRRIYLQQALYAGIGEQIKQDFSQFHWVRRPLLCVCACDCMTRVTEPLVFFFCDRLGSKPCKRCCRRLVI